ncbi:MAG TPA: glycoside hydrolase family 43 protein [Chitinophagaceae bacterium]|nr:glycoside hydrolase family 43 protein [Chitinophagaceae bacterium]
MRKHVLFFILLSGSFQGISQQKFYTNPILAGFYPDPSICRVKNDYYLVNSSFAYFPGLPIFHSKDLVNWEQVGHAMDRRSQLDQEGAGVSRGLFAPDISFHNGTFYITCTLIDKGGNFIITAKNPAGPWSDPVWLPEVKGIDPSLFFDDDGRLYIVFNSIPPENHSLYNGHRTIRMIELDPLSFKVKTPEKILINGGTDIAKKPVWIEGPHFLKKDGWYYLLCAEGGTAYEHSEVVFRSHSMEGPFESYSNNPILTQRHLDPARANPITTTGHADLVDTKDGKWYAVFLGCRPYGDNYYNIGRETFMLPVNWNDGWPMILEGKETVEYRLPVPIPSLTKKVSNSFSGNLHYHDDFNSPALNHRWIFLRTPREKWHDLSLKKGFLSMHLRPETCGGKSNPSFIAHRQQNLACSASTSLLFKAANENEKAGLMIFQNETHFYYLCLSVEDKTPVIQLFQSTKDSSMQLLASQAIPSLNIEIGLKIEANTDSYSFYFSTSPSYHSTPLEEWKLLKEAVDGKFLSTKVAGGFVGSVFALYVTSLGKPSSNKAFYDWFDYRGADAVYILVNDSN